MILHANGNDMKVGVGNTHIRQKSLKKVHKEIQRRTLYNDKEIITRRYKNYIYVCTQHRSTSICKANTNKHKGIYQQ